MNFTSKAAELSSKTELFVKDEVEERTIRAFLMPVYSGRGSSACPGWWSYSRLYLGRKETESLSNKSWSCTDVRVKEALKTRHLETDSSYVKQLISV